jgi:Luciferase-like monooxygenase
VRLIGAAIIAPLRHPVLLAHQLATLDLLCEGRLVVQPTVSWHREEYAALGVPFERRGELLDEHLAAWQVLWRPGPASFDGRHYRFSDVYLEPKPFREDGPRLWFGGMSVGPWIVRRLVEYGHGFHPFGQPGADELRVPIDAIAAAGRSFDDIEVVGGIRGRFPDPILPPTWPKRWTRSPPSSRPATPRSASSRRNTSTTRRRSGGCAASLSVHSAPENSAVRSTTVFTSA